MWAILYTHIVYSEMVLLAPHKVISEHVMPLKYRALIGWCEVRDLNTELWLAGELVWLWVMALKYRAVIGSSYFKFLCSLEMVPPYSKAIEATYLVPFQNWGSQYDRWAEVWLAGVSQVTWIQSCDWLMHVTWLEYSAVIGWFDSRD